jgi:hypothetical protein
MRVANNDIDNVNVSSRDNYNDIDNDNYRKAKSVEFTADRLLTKLGAKPESRPFMCKVAWKLSEARIWDNAEQAIKGRNPMGLFIYLCKRDGV